jgi:hypothetical protein
MSSVNATATITPAQVPLPVAALLSWNGMYWNFNSIYVRHGNETDESLLARAEQDAATLNRAGRTTCLIRVVPA